MDEPSDATSGLHEERRKGNLSIRIDECWTLSGGTAYLVSVVAWNAWAGQGKLLFARSGPSLELAQLLFAGFSQNLRGYDWHEGDFLLEDR